MKNFGWLVLLGILYYGWQAGWFDAIIDYFSESSRAAREERVIEHEDGLVSTYGSLNEELKVKEGDIVNRGQEIGAVSDSSSGEIDAGAHLHFSLTDEGKNIDPAAYLNIETK